VGEIIGYLWKLFCGWPGRWHTVYQRFNRWCRRGVWESLFKVLNQDADFEYILVDSTLMRAHQHSAGAPKKSDQSEDRFEAHALGRSLIYGMRFV
jgi:transposase